MLSPECVSLVYPPNTIIPRTPAAVKKSQLPTIFSLPYFTKCCAYLKLGVVKSSGFAERAKLGNLVNALFIIIFKVILDFNIIIKLNFDNYQITHIHHIKYSISYNYLIIINKNIKYNLNLINHQNLHYVH
jgi:hypothetical protein